jgi:hypothetical protein
MEALEPVNKHRAILLFEDILPDFHDVIRPYTYQMRVECSVMQTAE